jgi:hypothetical protein
MSLVIILAVIASVLVQTPSPLGPVRLGPTGDRLSADDLAQASRIAGNAGVGQP